MRKPKLHVVIASTRPGRAGPTVARWFHQAAIAHGGFAVDLVDLADFALPVYDEPELPREQRYQHEHTRRWSASVAAADAFVLVMPEYNFNPPPALVNALHYLYAEWNYKPVGFVSYAYLSGGLRAVEAIKPLLLKLRVVPITEQVAVPMFGDFIRDGVFEASAVHGQSATVMLDELARWTRALAQLRQP